MSKENEKQHLGVQLVFQDAIKNIEKFTFHNASATVPHLLNLDIDNRTIISKAPSFLKQIINYFCYFGKLLFPNTVHGQERRQAEVQEELMRSVIIIKKHSPILDKFKNGSEEQQKLARLAQEVVAGYNSLILQARQPQISLKGRFFKFLCERIGVAISDQLKINTIDLSTTVSAQVGSLPPSTAKVSSLGLPTTKSTLTQNEVDAFCMKAITMIKNHDIPVTSIRETLSMVKKNPIQAQFDRTFGRDGKSGASIVSLSQKVNVFPGEMIEFRGAFKRDSHSNVLSIPISESFQLSSLSVQDGFPHPSQYHGFALMDKLIPSTPLRLDQLSSLQHFYEEKKRIAHDLLPQGSLIQKAKAILKLKKQVFQGNKDLFLTAHKKLSETFLEASGSFQKECVDSFFKHAYHQENVYDFISQTYQRVNELFVLRPYEKLIEAWVEGLLHEEMSQRYITALKILEDEVQAVCQELEQSTECQEQYILCMGKALAPAGCNLILQHQSEKMEFAPYPLRNFDCLVQAWAFKQANTFQQELGGNIEEMHDHLMRLIDEDIALFKVKEFDQAEESLTQIVHDLEDYFNARFSNELKLK